MLTVDGVAELSPSKQEVERRSNDQDVPTVIQYCTH